MSRLAQNVQADTIDLAAIRFDGLPVSLDAAALLDEVEFADRRAIDAQELTAFIRRNRPQFLAKAILADWLVWWLSELVTRRLGRRKAWPGAFWWSRQPGKGPLIALKMKKPPERGFLKQESERRPPRLIETDRTEQHLLVISQVFGQLTRTVGVLP